MTVLEVSISVSVTCAVVKSSLTFLISYNLITFLPTLFHEVVTKVSLSIHPNLADWNPSLIWCFKICLLFLGSNTCINLFLVVAPINTPLGDQFTQVGVSSALTSHTVSPWIAFHTCISPLKAALQTTSDAIGLNVTKGTFLVCLLYNWTSCVIFSVIPPSGILYNNTAPSSKDAASKSVLKGENSKSREAARCPLIRGWFGGTEIWLEESTTIISPALLHDIAKKLQLTAIKRPSVETLDTEQLVYFSFFS